MSDGCVYVCAVQIGNALAMINFALARRELGYRPIILQFMYDKRVAFFAPHIDSLIDKERQRRRDKSSAKPAAPVVSQPKAAVKKGSMKGEAGVERSEDEEEEGEEGGENVDTSNMPAPGTRMDVCLPTHIDMIALHHLPSEGLAGPSRRLTLSAALSSSNLCAPPFLCSSRPNEAPPSQGPSP